MSDRPKITAMGTPYVVHTSPRKSERQGYLHASRHHGRWHKPTLWERIGDILRWGREDGQSPSYGIPLLIALFVLSAIACAAWGG
jgi:hypothetical protein